MRFFPFVILLLGTCLALVPPAWGATSLFDQQRYMEPGARLGDAEEMLGQWLGEHPEDGEARFLMARVLFWQGKHDGALAEYGRLLATAPENGDYLLGQALALMRSGRALAALRPLDKARRLNPDSEETWRLHIEALRAAGGKQRQGQARMLENEARRRFPHAKWSMGPVSPIPVASSRFAALVAHKGLPLGYRARV